jgi:uncharacterized protein (DUF2235 family)
LDDKVLAAYEFIIDHYQDGDDIFLFGFSRGAHAVRVLAGFLHKVGLLSPQQKNLAGAALTAYMQTSADIENQNHDDAETQSRQDKAWQFARIVSSRWLTIKFVGVWDTVASIIVPRPDKFYTFSLQSLPFTIRNPSVEVFRQAIAIDERRRMFRLSKWQDQQKFLPNRFDKTCQNPQDIKQVWFAGVHSDVGGGYSEIESGISKFPLLWMISEAKKQGLIVTTETLNQLGRGQHRKGSPFQYQPPCLSCTPHNSMTAGWHPLEWWPKADKYKEWAARKSLFGRYIPDSEPRLIPENALIHQSVFDKMDKMPSYRPVNIPKKYQMLPYDRDSNPESQSQSGIRSSAISSS